MSPCIKVQTMLDLRSRKFLVVASGLLVAVGFAAYGLCWHLFRDPDADSGGSPRPSNDPVSSKRHGPELLPRQVREYVESKGGVDGTSRDVNVALQRELLKHSKGSPLGISESSGYSRDICYVVNGFGEYYYGAEKDVSFEDPVFRRVVGCGNAILEPLVSLLDTAYGRDVAVSLAIGMVLDRMASAESGELILRTFERHPELDVAPTLIRLGLEEQFKHAMSKVIRSHWKGSLSVETLELFLGMRQRNLYPDVIWYMENGPSPGMVALLLAEVWYDDPPLVGFEVALLRIYERARARRDWGTVVEMGTAALLIGLPASFEDLIGVAMSDEEEVEPFLRQEADRVLKYCVATDVETGNWLSWLKDNWRVLRFDKEIRRFVMLKSD